MISKLSPKILVSTVMGAWYLASAFAQYLAGIISQFTVVDASADGGIPAPINSVNIYGNMAGGIAIACLVCGGACLALSPILKTWMHPELPEDSDG